MKKAWIKVLTEQAVNLLISYLEDNPQTFRFKKFSVTLTANQIVITKKFQS